MYKVLDPAKFKYAGQRIKNRKKPLQGRDATIIVDPKVNMQLIPVNSIITTPLAQRTNYWEIHFGKNGEYGIKDVEKLAIELDAIAYFV
jgi:hypothetical protein|tara:strand:+ start:306 stop:572 length:267 start_codon:yes stop_codon:yes gene_type:complete